MHEAEHLMARSIVNEYLLEITLFNLLCVTDDPSRTLTAIREQVNTSLQSGMRTGALPGCDRAVTQAIAVKYSGEVFDRLAKNLAGRKKKS